MNKEVETLITGRLDIEQAYDTRGYLRPTLHSFSNEYVNAVREGLATLIETRELSVQDYDDLTNGIEFEDEDSLYEYLGKIYDYLFGDLAEQPRPPE
ncbi:hypothetical protein [Streptomyces abikoensis]|uniref:hypothetical protein n=1 Tax=Streptomyces abikoensis TaxID=97398 RepID=UPI0036C7B681